MPSSGMPSSGMPPYTPPIADRDSCGADGLQHLLGGPVPQPFPARGPVRIFATGQPVTMDYSAQRVNVEVDHSRRPKIVAITCG